MRRPNLVRIELAEPFPLPDTVRALCASVRTSGPALLVEPRAEIPEIVAALVRGGARIAAVAPQQDRLEDAWLQLLAEARAA